MDQEQGARELRYMFCICDMLDYVRRGGRGRGLCFGLNHVSMFSHAMIVTIVVFPSVSVTEISCSVNRSKWYVLASLRQPVCECSTTSRSLLMYSLTTRPRDTGGEARGRVTIPFTICLGSAGLHRPRKSWPWLVTPPPPPLLPRPL